MSANVKECEKSTSSEESEEVNDTGSGAEDDVFISSPECTRLLKTDERSGYNSVPADQKNEYMPFPKSVGFIIGNEFCERFSYYGMRAILTLYLKYELDFTEDKATMLYHGWCMLCYFSPVLGAMLADSVLGRYKTIFYISIVYAVGSAVLSVSAIPPIMPNTSFRTLMSVAGLLLIAFGTGGIKPCVSAFGGDQFILPQQERQLSRYFTFFYCSINAGSLLSTLVTPILREDVSCFKGDCYALAFGFPAALMIVALGLFVAGTSLYRMVPPEGNIALKVISCISVAVRNKLTSKEKRRHWLDHARPSFDSQIIYDVKILLQLLLLFLPLPIFWALFDQQGSRWTFQATHMDGKVGPFTIKPDQMQVINPLLILVLLPLFDTCVYPMLHHWRILTKPLQRIMLGGMLAAGSFAIAGFLELQLGKFHSVPLSENESHMAIINTLPCDVGIKVPWHKDTKHLPSFGRELYSNVALNDSTMKVDIKLRYTGNSCHIIGVPFTEEFVLNLVEKMAQTFLLMMHNKSLQLLPVKPPDDNRRSNDGLAKLRLIRLKEHLKETERTVLLQGSQKYAVQLSISDTGVLMSTYHLVEADRYEVFTCAANRCSNKSEGSFEVGLGGVYNIILQPLQIGDRQGGVHLYEVVSPNKVHMFWLIPQYFVITIGEVMFSVTGLEFSFTQAPASMKSVVQSAWLLTVSVGNLIVMVIAETKFFENQASEFFFFAGLMAIDMLIFGALAMWYQHHKESSSLKSFGSESSLIEEYELKGDKVNSTL